MNFDFPLSFWLLGLLLAILIWHLKERRRTPCVVPSLNFWVDFDSKRPRLFRVRQNLFLFSCFLLVAATLFTAARPYFPSGNEAPRYLVLLDNSASMGTQEEEGSRWEIACRLSKKYVNEKSRVVLTTPPVVMKAEEALRAAPSSETAPMGHAVEKWLDLISPEDHPVVITDGAGAEWPSSMEIIKRKTTPWIHVVGERTENMGLEMSHVYASWKTFSCLVEISNLGKRKAANILSWKWEGNTSLGEPEPPKQGAIPFELGPGEKRREWFSLSTEGKSGLFGCELEKKDFFPYDDHVFCTVSIPRKARILILSDDEPLYLRAALASYPEIVDPLHSGAFSGDKLPLTNDYDLIIMERKSWNGPLPGGNYLFLGSHVPSLSILPEGYCNQWAKAPNPGHPIAKYLDCSFRVSGSWKCTGIPTHSVILHGSQGPLIWEGENGPVRYVHVSFRMENSTMPFFSSFPVFIHNVVLWALRKEGPTCILKGYRGKESIIPFGPATTNTTVQRRVPIWECWQREMVLIVFITSLIMSIPFFWLELFLVRLGLWER